MQLGSLQYPHNPMKGASEHFHFLSVLAGTYDDTVRNIDIDRAGYLRHDGSLLRDGSSARRIIVERRIIGETDHC